jgi:hypothetical protein
MVGDLQQTPENRLPGITNHIQAGLYKTAFYKSREWEAKSQNQDYSAPER